MFQLLDRLRQKSDLQKKTIAFAIATLVSVIILVTWLSTFSFDVGNLQETTDTAQTSAPVQTLREQFGIFKASLIEQQAIEE